MTTRLVVAYGLIALMAAFAATVGSWAWYRSQARADSLQRKRARLNYAVRRDAREAAEAAEAAGKIPVSGSGTP